MQEARWETRNSKMGAYSLTWRDREGLAHSAEARGLDVSKSGIGIECLREVKPGTIVYIQARDGSIGGDCVVVHCTRKGMRFHIGLELRDESEQYRGAAERGAADDEGDYYEVLQISPKAELETIHRVFRIMAARFHPDNPETGDVEQFLRMKQAYTVLSDAVRRSEYDAQRDRQKNGTMPIFELKDFVTGVEAEANRRLGVLSLLYNKRRMDPDSPGISLLDLEQRMGFPREYLSFTMWYLRSKAYVMASDNSDYALTAAGADYVESNAPDNEILTRLLRRGSVTADDEPSRTRAKPAPAKREGAPRPAPQFLVGPDAGKED